MNQKPNLTPDAALQAPNTVSEAATGPAPRFLAFRTRKANPAEAETIRPVGQVRAAVGRHGGRMLLGAVNTLAVAGIAALGFSYAERPWPLLPTGTRPAALAPQAVTPPKQSATLLEAPRGDSPVPVSGPPAASDASAASSAATLPAPIKPDPAVVRPRAELAKADAGKPPIATPTPAASPTAAPAVAEAPPASPAVTSPAPGLPAPASPPAPPTTTGAANADATKTADAAKTADPPKTTEPAAAPTQPRFSEPLQPSNKQPASETAYVTAVDELIAPIRALSVTVEDATHVRDAFAAGSNAQVIKSHRDQIKDPVARKLVGWHLLKAGAGTGREIRAFLAANPDWPNRDLLTQRAEEYIFMTGGAAKDIKAFFADQEPRTAIGLAALASALLAEQDEAGAAKLAAQAWRTGDISPSLENGFVDRFGKLLTADDHKWRLDRLLMDDQRWEGDRKDRAAVIRRVIAFLSEAERAKANARLAVFLRAADANKLMAALPADAATSPKADWGFAFSLAQWHRRAGRLAEARQILLDAPVDAALAVSLDDWWEERRLMAYEMLKAGEAAQAYALVKEPGDLPGVNARKDAAFTAGWIALRHLKDAKAAERHFTDLAKAADGPQSRARAAWWLAKTHEALGDTAAAKLQYEAAAKNLDTFYGLLSIQALEPERTELKTPPPRLATAAEAEQFAARDAVKAVVIARRSGLDASITRALLVALRNASTSEAEHAMIAHLAEAIGDTQMSVRLAKASVARGYNLLTYAYPVHPMPAYQPLRAPPEPAFLLGVARQESEFSQSTKSGAGAKGLLQVMTVTAQHICKDYKIKCEIDRLMTDKSYNAMMASAYLGDRMDEFTGSYVLTLSGYNAGPGRTRQWIREFGDPRDPAVDPVDWINRIPFEETREYVQKVLANIQIYRSRLGEDATALRITQDLRRNAPSSKRVGSGAAAATAEN